MVVDMVRDAWWYWGTSGKEGAEFRVLGGSQVSSRVSCTFASWKAVRSRGTSWRDTDEGVKLDGAERIVVKKCLDTVVK